ncbi:MAG: type II toxin-antitoxin system Phd/YefM family antitoxin [Burkholderiales bacterium]|nr:MAG: type II toxin-antitoxin system Phd/YefM family antitoxin [Betaproteobacteria bacterium]TAG24470.1 MAG: type II toxin-antitoxin system Phd/YefM family antitoxin [Burkholderiales bacterium]
MLTLSSLQAQNKFGELIDTAQREPVAITRRGRTVAYVIDHYTYRRAMSEMFPLRDEAAAAELERVLTPVRARALADGLTEEKLAAILDEK